MGIITLDYLWGSTVIFKSVKGVFLMILVTLERIYFSSIGKFVPFWKRKLISSNVVRERA